MPTIKSKVQFLKELIALKEVSDAGTIGAAALKNGLKSTNLSKLITSLETRLNTVLISRTSKGIYLLDEAVKLNETTETILQLLDVLFIEHVDHSTLTGCVSVWSEEDYIGVYFLDKLQKFLQSYPHLKIKIFSGAKTNLKQMDLIISSQHSHLANTKLLYQAEVNSHFCISQKYIQKYGKPKDLTDLLNNHFLCMRHCDVHYQAARHIIKTAKHLNITADETSIIFRIIQNGDAVGILPEWCENIDPAILRLDHIPITLKQNFDVLYNMNPKNLIITNVVLSFIQKFIEERDKNKKLQ